MPAESGEQRPAFGAVGIGAFGAAEVAEGGEQPVGGLGVERGRWRHAAGAKP